VKENNGRTPLLRFPGGGRSLTQNAGMYSVYILAVLTPFVPCEKSGQGIASQFSIHPPLTPYTAGGFLLLAMVFVNERL